MTHADDVLVTGFPRLLARLVVQSLVEDEHTRVSLLVRPKWQDDARRFTATLGDAASRVNLVEGDVTSIDLGLGGAEYLALARRTTAIHHAAEITYEGSDARRTAAVNVQGTREVLEFARAAVADGGFRRLVAYTSTLVAGDHEGTFHETDLDVDQGYRSPVEETLYRAERLLRAASRDIPTSIVRPSIVVGHSQTGEIDVFDGPYLYILLLLSSPVDLTLPLPSRGDLALNMVPVDYVARAGVALGRDPAATSRTLHLVDPAPLPARRVFELVARAAGRRLPRGFIPVNITRALLRTPGLERFAKSPRVFIARLAARVSYTSQGAREILGPHGIECPPFDRYVDVLVDYVRLRLAARRARTAAPVAEDAVEDPLA